MKVPFLESLLTLRDAYLTEPFTDEEPYKLCEWYECWDVPGAYLYRIHSFMICHASEHRSGGTTSRWNRS